MSKEGKMHARARHTPELAAAVEARWGEVLRQNGATLFARLQAVSPEVQPGDYYDEGRARWDQEGMQSDLKLARLALKLDHKLFQGERRVKAAAIEAAAAAAFQEAAGGSSDGGLEAGVTGGLE